MIPSETVKAIRASHATLKDLKAIETECLKYGDPHAAAFARALRRMLVVKAKPSTADLSQEDVDEALRTAQAMEPA